MALGSLAQFRLRPAKGGGSAAAGFESLYETDEKGKESLNDAEIQVRAALDGVGVVWTLEHYAAPFIAAGTLLRVLEDWCPPFPGYLMYYPSRRQQPAALSALIETLCRRHHRSGRTGCHHPHVFLLLRSSPRRSRSPVRAEALFRVSIRRLVARVEADS